MPLRAFFLLKNQLISHLFHNWSQKVKRVKERTIFIKKCYQTASNYNVKSLLVKAIFLKRKSVNSVCMASPESTNKTHHFTSSSSLFKRLQTERFEMIANHAHNEINRLNFVFRFLWCFFQSSGCAVFWYGLSLSCNHC